MCFLITSFWLLRWFAAIVFLNFLSVFSFRSDGLCKMILSNFMNALIDLWRWKFLVLCFSFRWFAMLLWQHVLWKQQTTGLIGNLNKIDWIVCDLGL